MVAGTVWRDMQSRHWEALATIIVVAIFLRVVAIDAYGLWTDEALTIVLSNWSLADMLLLPTDPTPILYYAIHKLFIPANASIEIVRSISVAAGVISVGIIYLLGRLASGERGGLIAAALLAVWTAHVDYSQEARAYSLLFLLTLLTSLGLLYYARLLHQEAASPAKANTGRRLIALALFGLGNILSFYTHLVAVFWIVLTSFMLLAIGWRDWRRRAPELTATFAAIAICAVPGIVRLVRQLLAGDDFHWLQQAGLLDFAATNANVLLPVGLWDNPLMSAFRVNGAAQAIVATASVALVGSGCWFGRHRLGGLVRERAVVLWLVIAYLAVPILIWLLGFAARPLFMDRTILFAVPGMILLITVVCLALETRVAASAALAAVFLYGASTLLFGIMREKEDWRGAYEYLAKVASPADVIAICPLYNYPALRYHAVTPVASAVLAVASDRNLTEVERGLGANPDWDKSYYHHFLVPQVAPARAAAEDLRIAGTLSLKPGQVIWRVDGECNSGFSADLDTALRGIAPDHNILWRQARKDPHAFGIIIRRYRIVAPVSLHIEVLSPDIIPAPARVVPGPLGESWANASRAVAHLRQREDNSFVGRDRRRMAER